MVSRASCWSLWAIASKAEMTFRCPSMCCRSACRLAATPKETMAATTTTAYGIPAVTTYSRLRTRSSRRQKAEDEFSGSSELDMALGGLYSVISLIFPIASSFYRRYMAPPTERPTIVESFTLRHRMVLKLSSKRP